MDTPQRFDEISEMYEELKSLVGEHENLREAASPQLVHTILKELKAGRRPEEIENWNDLFHSKKEKL